MRAGEGPASGGHPIMSSVKVADQNFDMHPAYRLRAIAGGTALEREPLAMRRRLQRDPARMPSLPRRPTATRQPRWEPSPERRNPGSRSPNGNLTLAACPGTYVPVIVGWGTAALREVGVIR